MSKTDYIWILGWDWRIQWQINIRTDTAISTGVGQKGIQPPQEKSDLLHDFPIRGTISIHRVGVGSVPLRKRTTCRVRPARDSNHASKHWQLFCQRLTDWFGFGMEITADIQDNRPRSRFRWAISLLITRGTIGKLKRGRGSGGVCLCDVPCSIPCY